MGILDNRVATYIKLKQYDRALTDSRQMIKRDEKEIDGRVDCTGIMVNCACRRLIER